MPTAKPWLKKPPDSIVVFHGEPSRPTAFTLSIADLARLAAALTALPIHPLIPRTKPSPMNEPAPEPSALSLREFLADRPSSPPFALPVPTLIAPANVLVRRDPPPLAFALPEAEVTADPAIEAAAFVAEPNRPLTPPAKVDVSKLPDPAAFELPVAALTAHVATPPAVSATNCPPAEIAPPKALTKSAPAVDAPFTKSESPDWAPCIIEAIAEVTPPAPSLIPLARPWSMSLPKLCMKRLGE